MGNYIYVADTETTVYEGQDKTEVWACGFSVLGTEQVYIYNNINDMMMALLKTGGTCYFHNLKFDGSFILQWLLNNKKYKHAIYSDGTLKDRRDMDTNEFVYSISARGVFYSISIKTSRHFLHFYDSFKLLPFALEKIAKDFKTKHQKLSMEYKGYRHAYGDITDDEKEYIKNDILVLNEAMTIMINDGHTKPTIGSCCMKEYKDIISDGRCLPLPLEYDELFPNLKHIELPCGDNADKWVRRSYRGGWCYCVKGKENRIFKNGLTADVNSLYPFVMLVNEYPYGLPIYIKNEHKFYDSLKTDRYYWFIRFKCKFRLKTGMLPFIQIKNSLLYKGNEMLESSCVEYKGNVYDNVVELTMTKTDFMRFIEFYDIYNYEFIDGMLFEQMKDLFTKYIDKYRIIKENSTGSTRAIAKLFLNNLYGKLATSDDSSYKTAYLDDGFLKWHTVTEHNKDVIYIPAGSAVTSYARDYTIRHAQANFHGVDERGFIYADTDSLHCDLSRDELIDIETDAKEFGKWDIENEWDEGIFIRQKTYTERTGDKFLVTCAGMGRKAKDNLIKEFKDGMSLKDFTHNLQVYGNLRFKQIKGGALLVEDVFTLK